MVASKKLLQYRLIFGVAVESREREYFCAEEAIIKLIQFHVNTT
jgi:hypothetical protein